MKEFIKRNFKNVNKIIMFFGVLFIPFIYSFVYMFGFSNQLSNSSKLDLRVIVRKDDKFSVGFSKELKSLTQPIKFGNMNFHVSVNNDAPENQIYLPSNSNISQYESLAKQYSKNSYASLVIKPTFTQIVGDNLYNIVQNRNILNTTKVLNKLVNDIINNNLFTLYLNYDASAEIATGISLATTTTPVYTRVLLGLFQTNPTPLINESKDKADYLIYKSKIENIWNAGKKMTDGSVINSSILDNLSFIEVSNSIPNNSNFAWLIAPFFIIIGTWMGGISLLLLISSKSNKKNKPFKNLLINSLILTAISIVQTTILVLSMLFLGFSTFGINLLYLFLTIILISIPLIILVQLMRYIIPNKILVFLTLIILLVIQMSVIGGFFGTNATIGFYKIVSYIFPVTYAIKLINISLYSFSWAPFISFFAIFFLLSIVVIIPLYFIYRKVYIKKQRGDSNV